MCRQIIFSINKAFLGFRWIFLYHSTIHRLHKFVCVCAFSFSSSFCALYTLEIQLIFSFLFSAAFNISSLHKSFSRTNWITKKKNRKKNMKMYLDKKINKKMFDGKVFRFFFFFKFSFYLFNKHLKFFTSYFKSLAIFK